MKQGAMLTFLFFYQILINMNIFIYIYMLAPPPPKTNILTPWQMFMCQSIAFHVDVEALQEFRRYFDSLAEVHVSEHCFPC